MMRGRKPIRFLHYDYRLTAWYFVTFNTRHRRPHFAHVINGKLRLTPAGEIAARCWDEIPKHCPGAQLDAFAIMPDHVHGLVRNEAGQSLKARIIEQGHGTSLTAIIGSYKSAVSRELHLLYPRLGIVWQRGFHERIVRGPLMMRRTRAYIQRNPTKWVEQGRR